jgi:hypothetical protein
VTFCTVPAFRRRPRSHLHRFDDDQRPAGLHGVAFFDEHFDDFAWHGGRDEATAVSAARLANARRGALVGIFDRHGRAAAAREHGWLQRVPVEHHVEHSPVDSDRQ